MVEDEVKKQEEGVPKNKALIWKDTCTPAFTVALFTIAKTWKQPKSPLKGTNKESVVYTQWNIPQP